MVNSRQLHFGFSARHEECEFICILLSTELLCANKWFLHNYVEHITANPCLPYLYLNGSGWQKEILCRLDQMHRCFNTDSIEALSYFKMGYSHYLCHKAASSQKPCRLVGFG